MFQECRKPRGTGTCHRAHFLNHTLDGHVPAEAQKSSALCEAAPGQMLACWDPQEQEAGRLPTQQTGPE